MNQMRQKNNNSLNSQQNKPYASMTAQSQHGNIIYNTENQLARKMSHQLLNAQDAYVEDYLQLLENQSLQKI